MKTKDIKSINNLSLRYQDYDNAGIKYAYDIIYTTLHSEGNSVKTSRQTGADTFRQHIRELTENYDGVATITVSDYKGISKKAHVINPPVTIELIDKITIDHTPKVIIHKGQSGNGVTENQSGIDVLQGLSGFFAGTEFEGLGNLAPIAKFIDDKHNINHLREKNEIQTQHITELERKHTELSGKYEQLQDEYATQQDELDDYHRKYDKDNKWASILGLAGSHMAKNFLRQHPGILSGFVSADQLSGILSDETQDSPDIPTIILSDEEQAQLDDATTIFEWLQTLDKQAFEQIVTIVALIRQNPAYSNHIIQFLKGGKG